MRLSFLGMAAAICIAAISIASFLSIERFWCSVANFADSQLRPAATAGPFVPPPGPIYLENDSYYWLSYAQRIASGKDWRVRHTNMDGFPTGREVHWSQVVSWSMVAFGRVRAVCTHETLFTAVEKASVAINPLLFALAAAGLFVGLARRFGSIPSALFTAFLASLGDVGWIFQALRPGHQSFHLVFGAVSIVGLVFGGLGLTTTQDTAAESWPLFQTLHPVGVRAARRWFFVAGVATGLALWVSATIESFFIYPMVGALTILLLLVSPAKVGAEKLTARPDLWRLWGVTSGVTGFLFYLVEYFPHHMAMRIEVNHPVYDLAVVGIGEFLRELSWLRWGGRRLTPTRLAATMLYLAVGLLPVALSMFGPVAWHHMRDPQMLRLHNFIQEFYTYNNFVPTDRWRHFFDLYGIVPFVSLLAPLLLLRRRLTITQTSWLWVTFALSVSFLAASFLQIRWMGFYAAASCLSALVAAHTAFDGFRERPWARRYVPALLVVVLLGQPVKFFHAQITALQRDLRGLTIETQIVTPILNKRLACALKASSHCPKAIIADPGLTPALGYFAGISCLTSFYWENLDGLHNAVRFLATKNPAEAHEVALRTGATHVIIPPGATLPNYLYFIAYGHYDTADATHTFAAKLLAGTAPTWIQPDTRLNFLTTKSYSYRGLPLSNRFETFLIEE